MRTAELGLHGKVSGRAAAGSWVQRACLRCIMTMRRVTAGVKQRKRGEFPESAGARGGAHGPRRTVAKGKAKYTSRYGNADADAARVVAVGPILRGQAVEEAWRTGPLQAEGLMVAGADRTSLGGYCQSNKSTPLGALARSVRETASSKRSCVAFSGFSAWSRNDSTTGNKALCASDGTGGLASHDRADAGAPRLCGRPRSRYSRRPDCGWVGQPLVSGRCRDPR